MTECRECGLFGKGSKMLRVIERSIYPTGCYASVLFLRDLVRDGMASGGMEKAVVENKREFVYATWLLGGYIRRMTTGMPGSMMRELPTTPPPELTAAITEMNALRVLAQGDDTRLLDEGLLQWKAVYRWLDGMCLDMTDD